MQRVESNNQIPSEYFKILCTESPTLRTEELACTNQKPHMLILRLTVTYSGSDTSCTNTSSGCSWTNLTKDNSFYKLVNQRCFNNLSCIIDSNALLSSTFVPCGFNNTRQRDTVNIYYDCFADTITPANTTPTAATHTTTGDVTTTAEETTTTVTKRTPQPSETEKEPMLTMVEIVVIIVCCLLLLLFIILLIVVLTKLHKINKIRMAVNDESVTSFWAADASIITPDLNTFSFTYVCIDIYDYYTA